MKYDLTYELKNIIDLGYQIFSNYTLENSINFDQEYGLEIKKRLLESPINDLNKSDLMDYLGSPKNSTYKDNEVKYFLPKIVELFINGENPAIIENDLFLIFNNVTEWKIEEINFLNKLMLEYFNAFLEKYYIFDLTFIFFVFRFNFFDTKLLLEYWLIFDLYKSLIAFAVMLKSNQYFTHDLDTVQFRLFKWSLTKKVKNRFENSIYESEIIEKIYNVNNEILPCVEYLSIYYNDLNPE